MNSNWYMTVVKFPHLADQITVDTIFVTIIYVGTSFLGVGSRVRWLLWLTASYYYFGNLTLILLPLVSRKC